MLLLFRRPTFKTGLELGQEIAARLLIAVVAKQYQPKIQTRTEQHRSAQPGPIHRRLRRSPLLGGLVGLLDGLGSAGPAAGLELGQSFFGVTDNVICGLGLGGRGCLVVGGLVPSLLGVFFYERAPS